MVDAADLLRHLEDRRQAMADLLERLVRLESPSRDAAAQDEVFAALAEALAHLGFRARRCPGVETGGVLVASPAARKRPRPYQLLVGHCDTVWPHGTLEEMPVEVARGRLRGPGSYDMKGGLVQGIFALEALRALGAELEVTPVFFINSDEEIGSRESIRHVIRFARGANRAFVLEPSAGADGKLKTARKGLGRFTIRVRGVAAHAGLEPEKGASAILELAHVIQKLFGLNDPQRGITVNVGTIDGGITPNVVAPESSAVVDVRVLRAEDAAGVEEAIHGLQAVTPGTRLEIEGRIGRPPMARTPRPLWTLARRAAGELGIAVEEETVGGGSDGNTTSQYTPTLDGLGPVGAGAHASHEFLFVERMPERSALLALLLSYPPLSGRER